MTGWLIFLTRRLPRRRALRRREAELTAWFETLAAHEAAGVTCEQAVAATERFWREVRQR